MVYLFDPELPLVPVLNLLMMDEQTLQHLASQLRKPAGDEGIKTGHWMNKGNASIYHDALKVLHAQALDNILEIGMGNGFFVKDVLETDPSIQYTGCDFSEVMVEEAKKINADWIDKKRAQFVFNDASSLPFGNHTFNKIFTINTIYFWEDKIKILNEINRVLQPGGKLIIGLRPKHLMKNYPFVKYGFNMFSKEDVSELLTKNGFSGIRMFENKEPDLEINGEVMKTENLVVEATKIS